MELTIHNIDPTVVSVLKRNAENTGMKLNDYLINIIESKVNKRKGSSSLSSLSGQWSNSEYSDFISNTQAFNNIDEELWK
jgi:hypothetical protein